ncbi:hypothetical protein [Pseudomonas sp. DSP3-2-2]|uniref:hypothetical protein n=1 Tax=unclassified Pseudomonas TaxID=196821 RepID=UPI003CFAC7E8
MNTCIIPSVAAVLSVLSICAAAETVVPIKGQSPETVQLDTSQCQASSGTTGNATTSQSGGRVRGATKAAVAGAGVAQVRGNQHDNAYDRVDDSVKQEYRQSKAKDAAVAGAVVGGSRQRQDRRDARHATEQASSAYSTCMQQRGYQVTP